MIFHCLVHYEQYTSQVATQEQKTQTHIRGLKKSNLILFTIKITSYVTTYRPAGRLGLGILGGNVISLGELGFTLGPTVQYFLKILMNSCGPLGATVHASIIAELFSHTFRYFAEDL